MATGSESPPKASDQLESWLRAAGPKTLGGLIEQFGEKSFAIVFIVLMAVPALPLPTGGVTHVFELVAMLLALELIAGRRTIWLPRRWRERELSGTSQRRFSEALVKRIRQFERFSRPRLSWLLDNRFADVFYGATVLVLALTAFLAPPFTGLDTLPAMGVVILSLGVLFEDALIAAIGIAIGTLGVVVVVGLGQAVARVVGEIL